MRQNKEIPIGYKDSPLGIIPEDWQVRNFHEISTEVKLGGNYENSEYNCGIPVIKMGNIGRGNINTEMVQYLPKTENYNDSDILQRDDLLFNTRNTLELVGKVAIWKEELSFAIYNSNLLRIYFDSNSVFSNSFMNYNFNGYSSLKQLKKYATGTTSVAAIYTRDLNQMKFALPLLNEQRKIVEILETWDNAIEKQQKLVEKLERRKRGLMQQLLKGDIRLHGLDQNWGIVKLGDIGSTYNGLTGKSKEDFGTGQPFITYMNVFSSPKTAMELMDFVMIGKNENQNKVQYGDILFTISSETPDEVGMSSVLLDDIEDTYLNSFCFGYRLFDFNVLLPEYAQHYFRSSAFRSYMYKLAQGSTRFNLSKTEVLKLNLSLPTIREQITIAKILSSADREIGREKEKLSLFHIQKKALTQQLLNGKTRVKI